MSGRDDLRQLTMLLHPFPDKVIKKNPSGGGEYVAHPVVEQRLIDVLGHPPATSLVRVIHGFVPGRAPNPEGKSARAKAGTPDLADAVVGAVLRMEMEIDGQPWFAEEVGDCEEPHNWPHDGARLKDAMSDAYKRCAMRAGVALHLWCKDGSFYLGQKLLEQDRPIEGAA